MNFSDDQAGTFAVADGWIWRQIAWPNPSFEFESENVEAGKQNGIENIGRRVQEEVVGILEAEKHLSRRKKDEFQEEVIFRERHAEIEGDSGRRCEHAGDEIFCTQQPLDHELFPVSAFCIQRGCTVVCHLPFLVLGVAREHLFKAKFVT